MTSTKNSAVISALHGFLPLLVVMVHSYERSDVFDVQQRLQVLLSYGVGRVAVPLYFIIAGYLFFDGLRQWDTAAWIAKLRRRSRTLLLPYVLWNIIAVGVGFAVSGGGVAEYLASCGGWRMLWNPPDFPLWFIFDLMVVCLAAPLVFVVAKRLKLFGVLLLVGVYLSGLWTRQNVGLSPEAVLFFTAGAYWRLHHEDKPLFAFSKPWRLAVYGAAAVLLAVVTFAYGSFPTLHHYAYPVFRCMAPLAVLNICSVLYDGGKLRQAPRFLAKAAFFIYAAHTIYVNTLVAEGIEWLLPAGGQVVVFVKYLGVTVVTYALCAGVHYALARVAPPVARALTGAR